MDIAQVDKMITRDILKPQPRYKDFPGAPFKIGAGLKVLDNPSKDETFDTNTIGEEGELVYYEYDCGGGQSFPEDPMIGVRLKDGKVYEYWKEELEEI